MSDGLRFPFRLVHTVALPALRRKPTKRCLEGAHYYSDGRDRNIDWCLPRMQLACQATRIVIFEGITGIKQTLVQMFAGPLMLAPDTRVEEISPLLKEHVSALQQADELILKQEKFLTGQEGGEDVGLRTDGLATLSPVVGKQGEVRILYISRGNEGWCRDLRPLGHGSTWALESRFMLANPEALGL